MIEVKTVKTVRSTTTCGVYVISCFGTPWCVRVTDVDREFPKVEILGEAPGEAFWYADKLGSHDVDRVVSAYRTLRWIGWA